MRISDIREMDTCVDKIPFGARGVHESCLRSYNILTQVKCYLLKNVPNDVILELIDEMEGK